MIFRRPTYYDKFKCTADKCSDSCCIGWEIDIDSTTADYYSRVGGAFGERLRNCISGGSFVLGENERCPFLNVRNLCDIYTTLGEEHLCQICSDHPRFYEWFGAIKEGGLGLCCEAAAQLILTEDFALTESVIDEPEEETPTLYPLLSEAREQIISHLMSDPFSEAMRTALGFCEELQEILDSGGEIRLPEWEKYQPTPQRPDTAAITEFFADLEPIDDDWRPYIERCAKLPEMPLGSIMEKQEFLRRIAVYYVYRFFMKSVFDGDVLGRMKLAAVCTWFIARLWFCGDGDFTEMAETAKNFSKEVEYSEENLDSLADAFYFDDIFTTSRIAGLFTK